MPASDETWRLTSAYGDSAQNDPNPAQDLLRRRDLDPISFPSGSGEESSPTEAESHNRLDAPTLIALLAARREARTPEEARSVAESYGVDLELVDRLATFVNPPSVQQDVVRKTDDGNETPVVRSTSSASHVPLALLTVIIARSLAGALGRPGRLGLPGPRRAEKDRMIGMYMQSDDTRAVGGMKTKCQSWS